MTTRTTAIGAAILAVALSLAACSDGSGDPAPAASGGSTATSSPSESGGGRYGYGDGGDTGSTGSADGGQDVARTVTVVNYQFSPATVKVASGDAIELTNTNPQTPHTFTVDGEDIDVSLDPGSSNTVTIDLPPGTYPFECTFHSSMGMRGTLKVSSAG